MIGVFIFFERKEEKRREENYIVEYMLSVIVL